MIRSRFKRAGLLFAVVLASAMLAGTGWGGSMSFFLDQTNTPADFVDGTNYLRATIDDTTNPGFITFTVEILGTDGTLFTPGTNFGIQTFGFNVVSGGPTLMDSPNAMWGLPTGWQAKVAPPPNTLSGFGRFDVQVTTTGSFRQDPLVFTIGVLGDSIEDYIDLSGGTAGEGNVFFAAHVAGYSAGHIGSTQSSGWFGGSKPVPIPGTVLLLGSGLAGLGLLSRRKRRG